MFCPQCKSILKPAKEDGKLLLRCDCGYVDSAPREKNFKERIQTQAEIQVAESSNSSAVYDHTCSKCKYAKAQLIEKGVWYSDEDAVVLYVCGSCGNTEMEKAKVK
ncbi:hypothetical protein HY642_01305 [Candidatus Woesearchaeota archaeon]|nr:hypothetical protein [Candidatus Woesearchaeota archaeon]